MSHRMISRRSQTIKNLQNKEYRDAYVEEHINQGLASQIRATRDERGWTQRQLAERLESGQSAVSKLEDPDYGRHTMSTLKRLASAFDVALVVRFVPFSQLVNYTTNISSADLAPASFAEDTELRVIGMEGLATTGGSPAQVSTTRLRLQEATSQLPLALQDSPVIVIRPAQATTQAPVDSIYYQAAGG